MYTKNLYYNATTVYINGKESHINSILGSTMYIHPTNYILNDLEWADEMFGILEQPGDFGKWPLVQSMGMSLDAGEGCSYISSSRKWFPQLVFSAVSRHIYIANSVQRSGKCFRSALLVMWNSW